MMSRSFVLRLAALLLTLTLTPCALRAVPELRTRVYPADTPVVLRITARGATDAERLGRLIVEYIREDGAERWKRIPASMKDGALLVPLTLRGEGGHALRVGTADENGRFIAAATFEFYSLGEDLFRKRPWRGDLHTLSHFSGGRQRPPRIAALGRRTGYDFIALTDRGRFASSVELAETVKKWNCGLTVLPGESWCIGGGMITVVAVGHNGGITPPKGTPVADASLDPAERAAAGDAAALVAEIRRRGGLAVFCHPAKMQEQRFLTSAALRRHLMFHGGFDAVEVLNAAAGLQSLSRVPALCREAAGHDGAPRTLVGVSGSSDAARVTFGRLCTVVFAPGNDVPGIVAALRRGDCVALQRAVGYTQIHGPSRLVGYALFLNRAYWPRHDRLCWKQGNALLGFIDGNDGLLGTVGRSAAELEALRREFWYEAPAAAAPAVREDAASTSSRQ